jgi:dinuclear metal center YbgI/SA1388 family protein
MKVQELVDVMQQIAPLAYAEAWDRAGLIVGSGARTIKGPVLLTIDLSEAVLAEAIEQGAGAIVAYHCPIWEPMLTLTDGSAKERIVRGAIEAGIAVYSPHTALDAAPGGVTDWLCEGLSEGAEGQIAGDCRALQSHHHLDPNQELKVVVFVPEPDLETVRNMLGTAGAGSIGAYKVCSFAVPGTGTFFGGEGAKPRVGQAGRLEKVPEHRLEMVCSRASLALVIQTLREFHPYEEPAIDVYELHGTRTRTVGLGRRLVLDRPATVAELSRRFAKHLKTDRVKFAVAGASDEPIRRVGVVPGAGEDLADVAAREGCEVFVTGEMRYHAVVKALEQGLSVILGGHTNTERGYLPRLAARLSSMCSDVSFRVSVQDRDLFKMAESGR